MIATTPILLSCVERTDGMEAHKFTAVHTWFTAVQFGLTWLLYERVVGATNGVLKRLK